MRVLLVCLSIFFTFLFSGVPHVAFAQVTPFDVTLESTPLNPSPYQDVSLRLVSYVLELDRLAITWLVDGEEVLRGTGATRLSTSAGAPGVRRVVEVVIQINPREVLRKQLVIQGASLDMLWQALDSYTPPFYRGKALPSLESRVRFTALPDSEFAQGAVYTWKNNSDTLEDASGFNKSSYIYRSGILDDDLRIDVVASRLDGGRTASSSLRIPLVDPILLFYTRGENNALDYSTSLPRTLRVENLTTMDVVAAPYYFSTESPDDIDYEWSINSEDVSGVRGSVLTVAPATDHGSASIRVDVENPNVYLQTASESMFLSF